MEDQASESEKEDAVPHAAQDLIQSLEEKIQKKRQEESDLDKRIKEQAEYVSYLHSVDTTSIANKTTRELIEQVLESDLSDKDKTAVIKKYLAKNQIEEILDKAKKFTDSQLNSKVLDTLKALKNKGKDLSPRDIQCAEDAIAYLKEDLDKIGKQELYRGSGEDSEQDLQTLPPLERVKYVYKNTLRRLYGDKEAV